MCFLELYIYLFCPHCVFNNSAIIALRYKSRSLIVDPPKLAGLVAYRGGWLLVFSKGVV